MDNLIGRTLGRYHITSSLGKGGMATVYRGYDPSSGQEVAIKIIRKEALAAEHHERIFKRFEREALALEKLSHPNIVNVLEYGNQNDTPFLVMEYVSAGTLKKLLGKPTSWHEAFFMLIPIAKALAYSHSKNIVHRDVKPANILLSEYGVLKLTDFGIAKILEDDNSMTFSTGTNVKLGTPDYMSPEQALSHEVDARTDIYSLGVVLYEMLTGRKPFTAKTSQEMLIKHINDPLPHPKKFAPGLPIYVERILLKSLEKDANKRFRTMYDFAWAMEHAYVNHYEKLVIRKSWRERFLKQVNDAREHFIDVVKKTRERTTIFVSALKPKLTTSKPTMIGGLFLLMLSASILYQAVNMSSPEIATTESFSLTFVSTEETMQIASPDFSASTMTASPTGSPMPINLPVQSGTPLPQLISPISLQSLEKLTQLAQWGQGRAFDLRYSPDGSKIAIAYSTGVLVLRSTDFSEARFIVGDDIRSIAFSSDGLYLATGDAQGNLTLWNAESGDFVRKLGETGGNKVVRIVFVQNTQNLVSLYGNGSVQIIDATNGAILSGFQTLADCNSDLFNDCALSPDGSKVAITSGINVVSIRNVFDGSLISTISGYSGPLAFSPDGTFLVTGGLDAIRVWRVESGEFVRIIYNGSENTSAERLGISSDGQWLAVGISDGNVKVFQVADGSLIGSFMVANDWYKEILFSPDQQEIITLQDSKLSIWSVQSGVLLREIENSQVNGRNIELSPNSQGLFIGLSDGSGITFAISDGSLVKQIGVPYRLENEFPPSRGVASNEEGQVSLTDEISYGEEYAKFKIVTLSPNSSLMASSTYQQWKDIGVLLHSSSDNSLVQTIPIQFYEPDSVVFSPDGSILAIGEMYASVDLNGQENYWGVLNLWNVLDGKLIKSIDGYSFPVAFSPDGQYLASGGGVIDNTVRVWRISDGAMVQSFQHTDRLYSIAFTPDGQFIASGGRDNLIRIWRVSDGALMGTMEGHLKPVKKIKFSPDGAILISMSEDGTLRFWEVSNYSLLATLSEPLYDFDISSDGNILALGSLDGTIKIWGVHP